MKIAALAGGVGGAKLADGLARVLQPENMTVIVNTGDDFDHFGLRICPDLDTVCYTLAGLSNAETGWGLMGETWQALSAVEKLGGPSWFHIGDRDLGTHLERTRRLKAGQPLSQVTEAFCRAWGVAVRVLPMSDDPVETRVFTTEDGELPFQEYFVRRQCQPEVTGFRFDGIGHSRPAPGVLQALHDADAVIICPSNPWVSISPILDIPSVRQALEGRVVTAVSPIVGGRAIKGPAAKMYTELGITPSAAAVAHHYSGLLSGFVMDELDRNQIEEVTQWGIIPLVTQTVMQIPEDRIRLAEEVLSYCDHLLLRRESI